MSILVVIALIVLVGQAHELLTEPDWHIMGVSFDALKCLDDEYGRSEINVLLLGMCWTTSTRADWEHHGLCASLVPNFNNQTQQDVYWERSYTLDRFAMCYTKRMWGEAGENTADYVAYLLLTSKYTLTQISKLTVLFRHNEMHDRNPDALYLALRVSGVESNPFFAAIRDCAPLLHARVDDPSELLFFH